MRKKNKHVKKRNKEDIALITLKLTLLLALINLLEKIITLIIKLIDRIK